MLVAVAVRPDRLDCLVAEIAGSNLATGMGLCSLSLYVVLS